MSGHPETCGAPSLASGSPARPRVTLALFAYNQQAHVRAAVEGALAQDYDGPLEIILSDDGSRDDTFAVMQDVARAYAGPHHIRLNRNDPNLGLSAHVNRVLAMAQGEIIVMAAGDDISLPGRVRETVAAFARHPQAMAVSFTDIKIDDTGKIIHEPTSENEDRIIDLKFFLNDSFKKNLATKPSLNISGASRAFRREVYTIFGSLIPNCPAEDIPYLLRSLYLGKIVISKGRPVIHYRIHDAQMSAFSGILRKNEEAFRKQFEVDKNTALTLAVGQSIPRRQIDRYIRDYVTSLHVKKLIISKDIPTFFTLLYFLRSTRYKYREKFGMVKRVILRRPL